MNYLFNDRNLIRGAEMALGSVTNVPSSEIFRTDMDPKTGSGDIALTGPYTGAADTEIELQIIDGDGDATQASPPVLTGVGTGAMTTPTATGLDAQQFAVTVTSLGTTTQPASVTVQGAILQATAPGPSTLAFSVSDFDITRTLTGNTLVEDLVAGTNEYTGNGWDFGAAALDADGNIPDTAPRISFGDDPQVYRAYKKYDFDSQQNVYSFSPPPVRNVPAGAKVKTVSGEWTVGIYNDDLTVLEIFTGASLYDMLTDIQADSVAVRVSTPITLDRSPNAMGATDFSVITTAMVLSVSADGSDFTQAADLGFTVSQIAPTVTVVVKCINADADGAEVWSVTDGVNTLANAITGQAYVSPLYQFTIPTQESTQPHITGNVLPTFQLNGAAHADDDQVPTMCVDSAFAGANATQKTFTFIYTRRPPPGCECDTADFEGGPDPDCLGLTPDTGSGNMANTSDSILVRQQRLAAAVRQYVGSNTSAPFTAAPVDIPWILDSGNIFSAGLVAIASGMEVSAWQASHVYKTDAQVRAIDPDGNRFSAMPANGISGSSGATEPNWSTAATLGATVVDGDITWTNEGKEALALWDADFEAWKDEMGALSGSGLAFTVRGWTANTNMSLFAVVGSYWVHPSTRNGWLYSMGYGSTPTRTLASQPTFPTVLNDCVTDGVAIPPNTTVDPWSWCARINYWNASSAVVLNTIINPGTGKLWKATAVSGNTGSSEPNFAVAGPITDGGVTWTATTASDLPPTANAQKDLYFQKWKTQMIEAAAAAGVTPNFGSATGDLGDGCWTDPGDGFYFASQNGLLPLFVNKGYHSAKLVLDPDTGKQVPRTTGEFYVGLKFGCPDLLKEGDTITIDCDGSTGGGTYQESDSFTIKVASASPLAFEGGIIGDNIVTLGVRGSAVGDLPPYYLIDAAPAARANSHAYAVGDAYVPAVANGHWYQVVTEGNSAAAPPTFLTDRSTFADGTAQVRDMGLVVGYNEGGLAFTISQGGTRFGLADHFNFQLIGGHYQWRQDGGSWHGPIVIGSQPSSPALPSGLVFGFMGGTDDPSWAADDTWAFLARAANGPYNVASPLDGRMTWLSSLSLTITPADNGPASRLALFDHHIPSNAVIALQGSDDNFSTTPTNIAVTWRERDILVEFAAVTRAKWRLTVDKGGDLFFAYLGPVMQPQLFDPGKNAYLPEWGKFTRTRRVPRPGVRSGTGGTLVHEVVCESSYQDWQDGLDYACANDGGVFGIVINDALPELALVRFTGTEVETKEALADYQRFDAARWRFLTFTVPVEAAP